MSHIHIPDGVLPVWLWVSGYLVAAVLIAVLWRLGRKGIDTRRFALLGIFAALMMLVMSIEFVVYHVNLSVVTCIILGPVLAIIAAFIVNLFLAFLGHGGITVVGLNVLVIAVEMLAGYGIFRLLMRVKTPLALAAGLAVFIGLGAGTAASYGIIALAAPAIDQSWQTVQQAHEKPEVVEQARAGGRHLDLRRLAVIMFGAGMIGWVLEAMLSSAILVMLNRVYPGLVIRRE